MKIIRRYKRRLRAGIEAKPVLLAVGILAIIVIMNFNHDKQLSVAPASYKPLLDLIADVESKGNYNAYFGNADNSSIQFTKMSIAEVQQWQKEQVASGSPSSAVGRYQIIDVTLSELVNNLHLDQNQLFDESTQDKMAIALLERRGSVALVNNKMSRTDFAANLAKEWASLPKITGSNPDDSYYAGDGLNRSLVHRDKVLSAVDLLKPIY